MSEIVLLDIHNRPTWTEPGRSKELPWPKEILDSPQSRRSREGCHLSLLVCIQALDPTAVGAGSKKRRQGEFPALML